MRVVAGHGVAPGSAGSEIAVDRIEWAEAGQVEHRAEIDEERIVALSGEYFDAAAQRRHRRGQRVVVRSRARPDVVGRRREVGRRAAEHARVSRAVLDEGHAVGLRPVPRRIGERRDRPGVVQKRVGVARLGVEAELVGQILLRIAVVVDVDLVEHRVVEGRKVRPAGRRFERNVVGDDRDRIGSIRAQERVQVGVVGHRVLADEGRFAVTRCLARLHRPRDQPRHGQHERDTLLHGFPPSNARIARVPHVEAGWPPRRRTRTVYPYYGRSRVSDWRNVSDSACADSLASRCWPTSMRSRESARSRRTIVRSSVTTLMRGAAPGRRA